MPDGSPWPRVSIVTLSYNQGQFIEETIRSVLLPGYPDLEYMIIDGGSTDGSVDIIRKYEPWLAQWVSEPDEGQADALAKGFQLAKGEILAWLNSDDYYYPKAVETSVEAFLDSPEADLIYGVCDLVDHSGCLLQRVVPLDFDPVRLRRQDYIWQPTAFFRRSVYERVGELDRSWHWAMDWDLRLRLSRSGRFKRVDRVLAATRIYKENKSRAGRERRYRELIKLFLHHRIHNRMLVHFCVQFIAYSLETISFKSPFLHHICFELPKPLLVSVNRKLWRAAGYRSPPARSGELVKGQAK